MADGNTGSQDEAGKGEEGQRLGLPLRRRLAPPPPPPACRCRSAARQRLDFTQPPMLLQIFKGSNGKVGRLAGRISSGATIVLAMSRPAHLPLPASRRN